MGFISLNLLVGKTSNYFCVAIPQGEQTILVLRQESDSDSGSSEIRKAKDRMRLLFDSLPVALFVVSREGLVEAVNPTAVSMFAYSKEELSAVSFTDLLDSSEQRSQMSFMKFITESLGTMCRLTGVKKGRETFSDRSLCAAFGSFEAKLLLFSIRHNRPCRAGNDKTRVYRDGQSRSSFAIDQRQSLSVVHRSGKLSC